MKYYCLIIVVCFLPEALAQENARILESSYDYTIKDDSRVSIVIHERIRILNEAGYALAIFQDYEDNFRSIDQVNISITDANGEIVQRYKKGKALIIGYNPSYEINDAKVVYIDPKYKNFPFIIDVEERVTLNGFISLPTWIPQSQFHVGVDRASLSIQYNQQRPVKFKEIDIDGTEVREGELVTRRYVVERLDPVKSKRNYRDFYEAQKKVLIAPENFRLDRSEGSNRSWREFGNWFLALNSAPSELSDTTKAFIDQTMKTKGRDEWIREFYHYMQDRTRYVSIQLGVGGFRSLPIKDVEAHGYGDCKALSTYMKGMLEYAGIKSNYILVRAGENAADVVADFPSSQFNHVFVGIPQLTDTLYLECTSQYAPLGYVGTFTDDRNTLWIEKDASKVIRSPVYSHKENTLSTISKVKIDSLGNATMDVRYKRRGVFFDELMILKMAPKSYVEKMNQQKFQFNDFRISNFDYQHANRDSQRFESSYLIRVNTLAKMTNDKMILPLLTVSPVSSFVEEDEYRQFCAIRRGMTIVDEITIALPDDYWTERLPEPVSIISEFGEYHLSYSQEGNEIKVQRKAVIFKGTYKGKSFEEWHEYLSKISQLEKRKVVLNSKT